MPREKLPNRRRAYTQEFFHGGHKFVLTFSRFSDGRLAEIFIDGAKPGNALYEMAKDMGTLLSISLQSGTSVREIINALSQENDGTKKTPLGVALQLVEKF